MACAVTSNPMNLDAYVAALSAPVRLADALDLLAVGLSLYLALGIIQVASSVGISSLRRKAETYRMYVVQNRKADKYAVSRDLFWQVHAAEVDADGVNRVVLRLVCICLAAALPYFVWALFAGELWITGAQLAFLCVGYIGVPVLLFLAGLFLMRRKSRAAGKAVDAAFADM